MGFGDSRKEARQLVLHSHFFVNGKPVNVSNIILRPNDEVSVRPKSQKAVPILRAMENSKKREIPDWVEMNPAEFKGKVKYLPERNQAQLQKYGLRWFFLFLESLRKDRHAQCALL
jgi:small subunit ribosomal protein S4